MERNDSIPDELLITPSPLINEYINYVNSTTIEYIPQFTLQSALTFFSHLYSRQYVGSTGLMTGIYSLIVGRSGIGKNYTKSCVQNFKPLNINVLSGATSDSGLFTALVRNPSLMIVSDEIGDKFNSKNELNKSYWRLVKDAYNTPALNESSYSGRINGKITEKEVDYNIKYPCLSMLGLTTPDQLSEGLSINDIKGGTINRFTIVNAYPDEITDNYNPIILEPSAKLCSDIISSGSNREINNQSFFNKTYSKAPGMKLIEFTREDLIMLNKKRRSLLMEKNNVYTVRLIEKVMKLSMIITISMRLDTVPVHVIDWCLKYEYYWTYNIKKISESVGGNDYAKSVKRFVDKVSSFKNGMDLCKVNRFCRESLGMPKYQYEALYSEFEKDKVIEIIDGPKSIKNGKSKKLMFYIGYKRK